MKVRRLNGLVADGVEVKRSGGSKLNWRHAGVRTKKACW